MARAGPRELVAELLRSTTCYDALPHSGKVVVFDVSVPIRLAFFGLVEHECTAAPLWDSARGCFAGMVTVTDFIQMMLQYHRAGAAAEALSTNTLAAWKAEQARRLAEHREHEESEEGRSAAVAGSMPLELTAGSSLTQPVSGGTVPPPVPFPSGLVQVRPDTSLLEACRLLRQHRIHRVAVVPQESDWARSDASAVCDAADAASKVIGDPVSKHDAAVRAERRRRRRRAAAAASSTTATSSSSSSALSASSAPRAPPSWARTPDLGDRLLLAAGMRSQSSSASSSTQQHQRHGGYHDDDDDEDDEDDGLEEANGPPPSALPVAAGRRVAMSRREGRLEDAPAAATVLGILTHQVLLHALVERFSLEDMPTAVTAPLAAAGLAGGSGGPHGSGGSGGGSSLAPVSAVQPHTTASSSSSSGSGHLLSESSVLTEGVMAAGVGTWAASDRQLVTATVDTPLAEVLALLAARRVSCVPLVEAGGGGRLLDVWGREDVLFLATDPTLAALSLPVRATRAAQLAAAGGVHSVRTCSPLDSVRSVIDIFAATRVARVVAVDASGRPVGVITISDIFQYFTG